MSQNVVVALDGVVSQAERKELTRSEQMLEVTSWSNRLDRRLQQMIKLLENQLQSCSSNISGSEAGVELDEVLQKTLPEIVELCVVAADHVYFVDRYSAELKERLVGLEKQIAEVSSELPVRSYFFAKKNFFKIKNTFSSKQTQNEEVALENRSDDKRELRVKYLDFEKFNEDKLVDNTHTPFALYDNWVTTFHSKGKTYGASNVVYSDLSERIFDLNKVSRIKDKKILEIGPFEGGNTKQLFDLGAKSITAIESNREFYFKTSLVKDAFNLDNLKLYFADCNVLLKDKELFPDKCFDMLYASGVLYHMSNPVETIEIFSRLADTIYVNSHVASEHVPSGEWTELSDSVGNKYSCRENTYNKGQHWGGVDESALWLSRQSMFDVFTNHGYKIQILEDSENNVRGNYLGFLAQK